MTTTAIVARFPLGVYHGHGPDGSPDRLPSPARLYSALVSAAYLGTTVAVDAESPRPDVCAALGWLERHPPTGLNLPQREPVDQTGGGRKAFRETGTIASNTSAPKKVPKAISDGTALSDEVAWTWESMPATVRDSIAALCDDVPCLGEMDSPVVLEVTEREPTWKIDPAATAFTRGGLRLTVPREGRLDELRGLHAQARPSRPPTPSKDKFNKSADQERPFATTQECLTTARFVRIARERPETPWGEVLVLSTAGETIPPERQVGWCVALHRALVGRIGDGAPSVVTGRYGPGRPVPANRVAIQYLPPSATALTNLPGPAALSTAGTFLVMLPSGIAAEDAAVVRAALAGMTQLRSRWGLLRLSMVPELVDTDSFWSSPREGYVRTWAPTPVAVPEVTRQRGRWAFQDAILLSLGFVFKDSLGVQGRGRKAYRALVDQVRRRGADVLWYRREPHDPAAYVHRMPEDLIAQPYHAQINGGDLLAPTALVAIGQSRHLGGGLLVPTDILLEALGHTGSGANQ